jgi:high-affinity iron transporter
MILSALFITWAVFFLHTYFGHKKVLLLQKVRQTIEHEEQEGIFMLVFTAVFREGFEIVLFLSTVYLSSNPVEIFKGFGIGLVSGLLVSLSLFSATLKLPVYYAFRVTGMLLILFAAGLLARGLGEFMEVSAFPSIAWLPNISLSFLPQGSTFYGHIIETIFGITRSMHTAQLTLYVAYISFMTWRVFGKKQEEKNPEK